MWTWRRKEPGSPSESPAPATLPSARAEWRALPPIQRVVAEHPLINPVQRFSSSLTSWRSPAYLEQLGHRVGPAEPAGVIDGLARTAGTPAPDMPVVQRSARKRGVLSRLWGMSVQRAAEPDPPESTTVAPREEAVAEEPSPEEPSPEGPGPAYDPAPAFVLPSVAVRPREADRPSMPLTSAEPSVIPASPPVRTVQAVRPETPMAPLHPPGPADEQSSVDSPDDVEPAAVDTPAPEPDLADTGSVETAPVPALPLPAPPPVVEPAASGKTPPGEPVRSALPVVQRTGQAGTSPRRLGLGAPIVPEPGETRTPVPQPAEPAAVEPEVPVPAAEDRAADTDAPLTGAVETTAVPAPLAEETAPVADDAPRPVARIAEGSDRSPAAASVETPTPGGSASVSVSRASATEPVQRSSIGPALPSRPPSPTRQDPQSSGAPVFKPVQRLRDDSPGKFAEESQITASRAVSPQPSLPMVPLSRSSPITAFDALEAAEPPGMPGGSASTASAPDRTAPTSPLPVARAVDNVAASSPVPATIPASRPTLTAPADERRGESAQLPALAVSRVVEARRSASSPLPSVRVLDGSAPPEVQRAHEPSLAVAEPHATRTVLLTPAAGQEAGGVAHPLRAALPVSRIADRQDPAPRPFSPRTGNPVSAEGTAPLPVAGIVEATPPGQNGRPSTRDVSPTVRRAAPGERADHGKSVVLDLPPVVVTRQAEASVVQREPEAAPPEPVAPPVGEPEPAAPSVAGPSAVAARAPQPETEELVKKLFDPLLRRLKTELRLDRERRGALTDRPH
ncbi:hypothetical protein [Amycolatopsis sp. TNS106]|uniref:hypothetical protein n=1 Tax=Amycolatopsis sp. TNS106 TaxID=2861750 RepID=UPI001C5999F1|nr:hypothetical protein [Amycolatopsis sp. TNS106]QXV57873.1 hypothetical protein CVV72_13350 [Amycolatopsis sp. TNS106]